MPKPEDVVVQLLKNSKEALTLAEIAEKTGLTGKKVFKALRKLFEQEIVDTQNRRYALKKK